MFESLLLVESPWTKYNSNTLLQIVAKIQIINMCTFLSLTPVNENVENCQQGERENVHEDQVEPSHVNLQE